MCLTSALPKILTEVETFGERCPGGQNPITLEYQIYPPTIDTIVTGMTWTAFAILAMFYFTNHGNKTNLKLPCKY